MTVTLSIQIECGNDTCNPSIYKNCKWLFRRCGLLDEPFCGLFNANLIGELKHVKQGSYKEYQRCDKCKEAQIESDT